MSSSWNKVCLPTEVDDFGVPDLSIDHGYAPRSGWPQTVVQASFLPFPFSIHFYLSKKSLGKFVKNGP